MRTGDAVEICPRIIMRMSTGDIKPLCVTIIADSTFRRSAAEHLTLTNLSVDKSFDIDVTIVDRSVKKVKGEIVTEEMHAKNTFEEPECVTVKKFDRVQVTEKGIRFTIPECSDLHLEVRQNACGE